MPLDDALFLEPGLQRLLAKEKFIQEELVKLAVTDPHAATILLCCCGWTQTHLLDAHPTHALGHPNDKLIQRTVDCLVHGFGLQSPTVQRSHIQRQISPPTRLSGRGLSTQYENTTSGGGVCTGQHDLHTLIPLGEETLEAPRRTHTHRHICRLWEPISRTGQHHLSRGRSHVIVGGSTPLSTPSLGTSP